MAASEDDDIMKALDAAMEDMAAEAAIPKATTEEPVKPKRKRKPLPEKYVAGASLLDEEDLEALREEAREAVLEDLRADERKKMLKGLMKEERGRFVPEETTVWVLVNLPGHSKELKIDGVAYHQGRSYEVPEKMAASMRDNMARAWEHEDVVGGVNRDNYRPVRETVISPHGVRDNITTSKLMRV